LINIEDRFVEMKAGKDECRVRVPSMEESSNYAIAYDNAKTDEEKKDELKKYLLGLGMTEKIYSVMRDKHFSMLLEEFKEKND